MKAMIRDTYGPPAQLRLADIDPPEIGAGDVLIRVHAAGVDQAVWHLVTGLPYLARLGGFGVRRPKNRVPGADVAGRVEAVGRDVTTLRPGDEVFGTCDGAFAEYARAAADAVVPKPADVTFEQAASVPTSACAALQALRDKGRVQAGQRVLVIGAGGGVGSFAVQLAVAMGAEVTGVCSAGKADLVRSLGATEVVDYTRTDVTTGERRFDVIVDIAGHRPLRRLRRVLNRHGRLVIVGSEGGGRWIQGMDRQLRAIALSPFVSQHLGTLISAERSEDLRHLAELMAAGTVVPAVDRTFPLADLPAAIQTLRNGQVRGKVVVVP
ncbi:NAD(P)-dependent alcohol dehydrogenase [Jiangella gansuensis]|uniref:NAD(P)-dependent alcohol dehydrogenase n=1 Tax=Jiangella gansuensis TaxID=281473 RepID=UPI00047AEC85|nr:NAD(P)-dependent alcohol dehydrogenase [Jiangella gansuensis]